MKPLKKRCTTQITWALAALMALQTTSAKSAHADWFGKKKPQPDAGQTQTPAVPSGADVTAQQLRNGSSAPDLIAPGTASAGAYGAAYRTWGELGVGQDGTGVYEGHLVTPESRRIIAIGDRGTKETRLYLVVRSLRGLGRDGSFLGILMHPERDHEHIALYRIDPVDEGRYTMTRLSLENGEGFVQSFISVENVNPELTISMRNGTAILGAASHQAEFRVRHDHDDFFARMVAQQVEFNHVTTINPPPAVAWTDGPASAGNVFAEWVGEYRGLYFAKQDKGYDRAWIDRMDVLQGGACTVDDYCFETKSHFSFLTRPIEGDFSAIERFPGMYTFSPTETYVDGEHTDYGQYIGVFLSMGSPPDGVAERAFGFEHKLYLIDPSNSANIIGLKLPGADHRL